MRIILLLLYFSIVTQAQETLEGNYPYNANTTIQNNSYYDMDLTALEDDYYNTEENDYYYEATTNSDNSFYENSVISNTNTNAYYMPPYKNFDYKAFKTKNIPQLFSSDGMLKNINDSYWLLKFYGHPDTVMYKYIELHIKDNQINIKLIDVLETLIEDSTYYLTPIEMLKPNEGIFAYTNKKGQLFFVYLHLLLPHLLAMDMVESFEEAQESANKNMTELGIFTLR